MMHGIPSEFYKQYTDLIIPMLQECYNFSYEANRLYQEAKHKQ